MEKTKNTYLSPMTEILVVRFEGVICESLRYGAKGRAGDDIDDGNEYDL